MLSRKRGKLCFFSAVLFALALIFTFNTAAEEHFFEAESFNVVGDGWRVTRATRASGVASLHGATGAVDSVASKTISIAEAGSYRLWVRHNYYNSWRGSFTVKVVNDDNIVSKDFDLTVRQGVSDGDYIWDYLDVDLQVGEVEIVISKYQNQNSTSYVRHVDCFLITTDKKPEAPDHLSYGPQTYVRVTLTDIDDIYDRPVYIHVFADHYREPWYEHLNLSKAGTQKGLAPANKDFLKSGENTGWCNITAMLYQDSGALLRFRPAYTYTDTPSRLVAKFEFATAPNDDAIVKVIERDSSPAYMYIIFPPDLTTPENLKILKTDLEMAEETGKIADEFVWPKVGKKPEIFPVLVNASFEPNRMDSVAVDRELRTLSKFGFNGNARYHPVYREYGFSKFAIWGGLWSYKGASYCEPDLPRMKTAAQSQADAFFASGGDMDEIVYAMLTDEPSGSPINTLTSNDACKEQFVAWLKNQGIMPHELLPDYDIASWDMVRPVSETEKKDFPVLYYHTQRFRAISLGVFMEQQRQVLEEAYGRSFPNSTNFSDGLVYRGNKYYHAVDYFELLRNTGQNALWSEDWANLASTYQLVAFNIDVMRAAANADQHLGHYLIAYQSRKPWDIKLKGVSGVARGIKTITNFTYGPFWAEHSKGWYLFPETWYANAELIREIGGAEDLLFEAKPVKAKVGIIYSTASDIWTIGNNSAYGFDRMHLWLALTHAQVPVDIIWEKDIEEGILDDYESCYLAGPNLTRKSAERLALWVKNGGTLLLTAGAGIKDEYDQPLNVFDELLPIMRNEVEELEKHNAAGSSLVNRKRQDLVSVGNTEMEVLLVRQKIEELGSTTEVLGTFSDGSPALTRDKVGKGVVYFAGFLPGISYIKPALVARNGIVSYSNNDDIEIPDPGKIATEEELLKRSYNPWQYPDRIREVILLPVKEPCIKRPFTCSIPLVDAIYMESPDGIVIPLANYTLQPLENVQFTVRVGREIEKVESVHHGELSYVQNGPEIAFSLPLRETDFIKIYFLK